jgi:hypothetical protein
MDFLLFLLKNRRYINMALGGTTDSSIIVSRMRLCTTNYNICCGEYTEHSLQMAPKKEPLDGEHYAIQHPEVLRKI